MKKTLKKLIIGIGIIVGIPILLFVLFVAFLVALHIFTPNPPKPEITYADFPFEVVYEIDGEIILVDEVLTPDSSRFWPADEYVEGTSPVSLDKQFVRDYLESLDWDKNPPAPELPDEVVAKTSAKYLDAYRMLTGKEL